MQWINLAVISAAFLQKFRICYLRSMVTGSTHASHCVTQPMYATVADNYAQNSMRMITLTKNSLSKFKIPSVFQN